MAQIVTTAYGLTGGVAAVAFVGQVSSVTIGGAWETGDTLKLFIADAMTAEVTELGNGTVSAISPNFCMTYKQKVYLLAGSTMYFSALDLPQTFNDPNAAGNGFVQLANNFATPEDLVAIAQFQKKLVFFSRQTTQIWTVNADPNQYSQEQVLENIGTFAPASVRSLGDLDVFFLSDTGVRSLRVRDSSSNAIITDVGSAIDIFIQAKLATCTDAQKEGACAIVESTANRYWLFLKDVIYVLSYFPELQIVAWSHYAPVDSTGAAFVPQKFVLKQGTVYARTVNSIVKYGPGYDGSEVVAELPWTKNVSPVSVKTLSGLDAAFSGAWVFSGSADYLSEETLWQELYRSDESSFDKGNIPWGAIGTHFKLKAVTTGAAAATLSSLVIHMAES